MNDLERNYYNTFVSVREFGAENAADFPAGSAGANNFTVVGAAVDEMERSGAIQTSGGSGQMMAQKNVAIAEVREDLRAINRTARARLTIPASASFSLCPTATTNKICLPSPVHF